MAIAEKPSVAFAKDNLSVTRKEKDCYFSVFGQYLLPLSTFDILAEFINQEDDPSIEIDLTATLHTFAQTENLYGMILNGEMYDIGTPESFRNTITHY